MITSGNMLFLCWLSLAVAITNLVSCAEIPRLNEASHNAVNCTGFIASASCVSSDNEDQKYCLQNGTIVTGLCAAQREFCQNHVSIERDFTVCNNVIEGILHSSNEPPHSSSGAYSRSDGSHLIFDETLSSTTTGTTSIIGKVSSNMGEGASVRFGSQDTSELPFSSGRLSATSESSFATSELTSTTPVTTGETSSTTYEAPTTTSEISLNSGRAGFSIGATSIRSGGSSFGSDRSSFGSSESSFSSVVPSISSDRLPFNSDRLSSTSSESSTTDETLVSTSEASFNNFKTTSNVDKTFSADKAFLNTNEKNNASGLHTAIWPIIIASMSFAMSYFAHLFVTV